jgi:hypothetical protein
MTVRLPPTPTMNSRTPSLPNSPRSRGGFGRPAISYFHRRARPPRRVLPFWEDIMTDPQSTPEPAIDETAFDQKHREYARRAEDIRVANKAVLFDTLAAPG